METHLQHLISKPYSQTPPNYGGLPFPIRPNSAKCKGEEISDRAVCHKHLENWTERKYNINYIKDIKSNIYTRNEK